MHEPTERRSNEMLVVTLGNGVRFVWRSEMRCLVPVDKEKRLKDLQPGDLVLFNNEPQTVESIFKYG